MKVRKKEKSDPKPSRMGLVEETALDTGDPVFTKEQLENFAYPLLRNLAAHANSDCINGKSNKLEVVDYYAVQYSLGEFEEKG